MAGQATGLRPNFYITQANFDELIDTGFWKRNDVPPERWALIKDHFGGVDTLAVLASGVPPRSIQRPSNSPIGGIDWVRIENRPRRNEPPLNVYHYVIGMPDEYGYPVYGPLKDGMIVPHRADLEDLDAYFADTEDE